MQALLENGQIVSLRRDCECLTHEGPHWLHMDDMDKRLNAPLRERALRGAGPAIFAYAQAELRRLGAKRFEMERQGISEILR